MTALGVRQGGRLDFMSRELAVELLPGEMFDSCWSTFPTLDLGQHLTVADLAPLLPPSGRFLEDPHRVVVAGRGAARSEAEEEAEAAALGASKPAEPELIRTRGKAEEEE